MNSLWSLLVIAILHLSKGINTQNSSSSCSSCGCPPGFSGTNCDVPVMKVVGSITYKIDATDQSGFNETLFTARLFHIFPLDVNVTVSIVVHNQSSVRVSFVVLTAQPEQFTSANVTKYQNDLIIQLADEATTSAAFPYSTSVNAATAKADVDECSSASLHSCGPEQVCFHKEDGSHDCPSRARIEIFCLLRDAPRLPGLATRSVRYENGSEVSMTAQNGRLPFNTHIVYTCPNRYILVNSASGSTQVDVIQCVGSVETTQGNTGWNGGVEVRCAMTLRFQIAIIMAAISSAIIVLMSGYFIVSYTKKQKMKDADRLDLGVNSAGTEHSF